MSLWYASESRGQRRFGDNFGKNFINTLMDFVTLSANTIRKRKTDPLSIIKFTMARLSHELFSTQQLSNT